MVTIRRCIVSWLAYLSLYAAALLPALRTFLSLRLVVTIAFALK
jgi:hypothetical protein